MNDKDRVLAKDAVKVFVDLNKSRNFKNKLPELSELSDIIDKSILSIKNTPDFGSESVDGDFFSRIKNEILREETVKLSEDLEIEKNIIKDHEPWLLNTGQPIDEEREKINYSYWNRYREFIKNQNKINMKDFDKSIRQIVSHLNDPLNRNDEGWLNKGMVVGSVQSGKTMNYAGVVSQAFDAGYQFILVLGGAGKKLRAQTQERIDEGVLGVDTSGKNTGFVGAGKIQMKDASGNRVKYRNIVSLTTSFDGGHSGKDGDFSTKSKNVQNYNVDWNDQTQPHLFVMKKNVSILKNFLEWIEKIQRDSNNKQAELSLLIIDDECDWGSIDTGNFDDPEDVIDENYDPSAINKCIVDILDKFKWKSYLGYTATPYANIFQRRDMNEQDTGSLFPSNFIVYLKPNRMYFGPSEFFNSSSTEKSIDLVRNVPNSDEDYFLNLMKERNDKCRELGLFAERDVDYTKEEKEELKRLRDIETFKILSKYEGDSAPESLKIALQSYILSCAIRWYRGERKVFNSMLIHIQRMVIFQDFIARMVEREFDLIKNKIINQNFSSLEKVYNSDFIDTTNEVIDCDSIDEGIKIGIDYLPSFDIIINSINDVVDRISVVKEFGKNKEERLDYSSDKKGNYYICIGSDVLSRGLTLEGLTVSYFLREAKTYDTLMQMGRWFGYRSGYLDVCRVFTTDTIVEFFLNVKIANEAMYQMFQEMYDRSDIPKNFGMYILSSDSAQKVTGYGKSRWTYNMDFDMGTSFLNETRTDISDERLKHNFKFINNYVSGRIDENDNSNTQIYHLKTDEFLTFLKNYRFSFDKSRPDDKNFHPGLYTDYINRIEAETNFNGFKLIITSGRHNRINWKINNKNIYSTERFVQVNSLKKNIWRMPKAANDGQLDIKCQNEYLPNKIGFLILRPMYGPSTFKPNKFTKQEIFNQIDNGNINSELNMIGLKYPVFHELLRLPSRFQLGLDENDRMLYVVDKKKYDDMIKIPFPVDEKTGDFK